MIVEVANVIAIQIGGMAVALAAGEHRLRYLIPAGFISGLCVHLLIGASQALLLMQTWPVITIIGTASLPVGWLLFQRRGANIEHPGWMQLGLVVAGAGMAAALFASLDRINFHVDSHEYMAIGALLNAGTFAEGVSLFQIEKRLLVVPLMHAPGNLTGSYYLASVTPLLAIATLLLLAWLCEASLRDRLPQTVTVSVAAGAALLLLTTNRFVQNAFYINGHLLFGALFLLLAGTAWLTVVRRTHEFVALQLLAIPVMVLTRAEAPLVVALLIAPIVLDRHRSRAHRIALVITLGGSVAVWQLFLLLLHERREATISLSILGMLTLGVAFLLLSPAVRMRFLEQHQIPLLILVEAGLWATLALAAVRDSQPLRDSLRATYENLLQGVGGWGYSLVFVAAAAALALVATRPEGRLFLRFPLTAFIPLVLLLAYFRDGAYRVGAADSLNRMLIHILPTAILFIATAALTRPGSPRDSEEATESIPAQARSGT